MTAVALAREEQYATASASQTEWNRGRLARLEAKGDLLGAEDREERDSLRAALSRDRTSPAAALDAAQDAYREALLAGDAAAASAAQAELHRAERAHRLALDVAATAPARAARRAAAAATVAATTRAAEARQAAAAEALATGARQVADVLVALHRVRHELPRTVPELALWSRAVQLAAADLHLSTPEVSLPLAALLRGGAF